MRTPALVAPVLVIAVLLLAGCGPSPSPRDPSGTAPVPLPSSTPTASPPSPAPIGGNASDALPVTRILLRTEIVSFGDERGWGVDGFRYGDDPAEAVAKLTAVFGAEPETTRWGDDGVLGVDHEWGGFLLHYSLTPAGELVREMGVRITAAEVHGITIETIGGVTVGQPMRDAARAGGTAEIGTLLEVQLDVVGDGAERRFVGAYGSGDGTGSVVELSAPLSGGG